MTPTTPIGPPRAKLVDGKRAPLEQKIDRLPDLIRELVQENRAREIERERMHREWEEQNRRRQEAEDRAARYRRAVESLFSEADRWRQRRANALREYLVALEAALRARGKPRRFRCVGSRETRARGGGRPRSAHAHHAVVRGTLQHPPRCCCLRAAGISPADPRTSVSAVSISRRISLLPKTWLRATTPLPPPSSAAIPRCSRTNSPGRARTDLFPLSCRARIGMKLNPVQLHRASTRASRVRTSGSWRLPTICRCGSISVRWCPPVEVLSFSPSR